jgi:hypothetical protein
MEYVPDIIFGFIPVVKVAHPGHTNRTSHHLSASLVERSTSQPRIHGRRMPTYRIQSTRSLFQRASVLAHMAMLLIRNRMSDGGRRTHRLIRATSQALRPFLSELTSHIHMCVSTTSDIDMTLGSRPTIQPDWETCSSLHGFPNTGYSRGGEARRRSARWSPTGSP